MSFPMAFFLSILLFIVLWRLCVYWSNWYLKRRMTDMAKVMRIDRTCHRAGNQGEFYRSMRDWK